MGRLLSFSEGSSRGASFQFRQLNGSNTMKMLGYGLTAFAVASVPTAASAADLYDYPPPRAAYIAPPPPPPVYPAYYYGYPRPYPYYAAYPYWGPRFGYGHRPYWRASYWGGRGWGHRGWGRRW
jgi:hypothetical protein